METHLADWLKATPEGIEAESILRSCVHCGFCNATCPTYQLLGDELDGPRGRIYQIKQVLEGAVPTRITQKHLDRCLTCLNCETTCPSGVRYGRLLEIGRTTVDKLVARPIGQRWQRSLLRHALTQPWLVSLTVRLGRALRPVLPAKLRNKLAPLRAAGVFPRQIHASKVFMLKGCVQPALAPSIDAATARVLHRLQIESIVAQQSGCCGALDLHLGASGQAQARARRNIDAWLPQLDAGAEAIVINASGCSAMVKDYAHLLSHDPHYADKARRITDATFDLAEYLPERLMTLAPSEPVGIPDDMHRVAFHPPCTLQHGQKVRGAVERLLTAFGAELVSIAESHLCCGSAGTYSILQPELSQSLLKRKLDNLQHERPALILSANIGCLSHLESAADVPVLHWIEWIDRQLA